MVTKRTEITVGLKDGDNDSRPTSWGGMFVSLNAAFCLWGVAVAVVAAPIAAVNGGIREGSTLQWVLVAVGGAPICLLWPVGILAVTVWGIRECVQDWRGFQRWRREDNDG